MPLALPMTTATSSASTGVGLYSAGGRLGGAVAALAAVFAGETLFGGTAFWMFLGLVSPDARVDVAPEGSALDSAGEDGAPAEGLDAGAAGGTALGVELADACTSFASGVVPRRANTNNENKTAI